MAVPCSNLPTQKPFSVLLVIFITFFLFLARKGNSQNAPVFSFTKFTSGLSSLTLQGKAEILADGVLALTNHENPSWNTGRALYAKPVRIWDSTTGIVASFVTSFSFIVEDIKDSTPADGIIFFLAPRDSKIPPNSAGGCLGVFDGSNNASNQFVGVEFDSYVNDWDPPYAHIGIDVNSLTSLKTVKWNRVSGSLVTVTIVYEPLSKTLTVTATNNNVLFSTVSQVVDLKAVLPEVVSVGLSATTTEKRETHDIHAWSFISTVL